MRKVLSSRGLVRSRAPLRLGFAGGGTDIPYYSELYGGVVLNATIDRYVWCTIQPSINQTLSLFAQDLDQSYVGPAVPQLPIDGKLNLQKAVYNRIVQNFNQGRPLPIQLHTHSDAPVGSGLGSSSTLTVAILTAFIEYLHLSLDRYEVAQLAFDIERKELGFIGGKQDQYAATFGGINFIEFYKDHTVEVYPVALKPWILSELEASLVLYFTGISRDSGKIIEDQIQAIQEQNPASLQALHEVKRLAFETKEQLLRGDIASFGRLIDQSWQLKSVISDKIVNPHMHHIYEVAKKNGALGGKVLGAGGGGFMLFVVNPLSRMDLIRALNIHPGQIMSCHFVSAGSCSWRIAE